MSFLDFSHQSLCLFMDTIPQNSTTCLLLKKMRSHFTHTCAPIYLFLYICIDPTWSHSYHSNHTQLFFLFTFLFLLLRIITDFGVWRYSFLSLFLESRPFTLPFKPISWKIKILSQWWRKKMPLFFHQREVRSKQKYLRNWLKVWSV